MNLDKLPKTRAEAKATGDKHYFTGLPCKHGHIAARVTKGTCMECRRIDWEKVNERRKNLPKSEASKEAGKRYYERNKDLVKARANNTPPEKKREYRNNWRVRNPEDQKAIATARKRRHRNARPSWLSDKDKSRIRAFYLNAQRMTRETGILHVVDHIEPLMGVNSCGLHVPWNLQVLTQTENLIKSNKMVD